MFSTPTAPGHKSQTGFVLWLDAVYYKSAEMILWSLLVPKTRFFCVLCFVLRVMMTSPSSHLPFINFFVMNEIVEADRPRSWHSASRSAARHAFNNDERDAVHIFSSSAVVQMTPLDDTDGRFVVSRCV